MSAPKHFLDLAELDSATLRRILELAKQIKADEIAQDRPLDGKALAMIFEKPSTRTRVSFERGVKQLGGEAIVLEPSGSQLGRGETIADTARVLSRYVDGVMIRTTKHEKLMELAEFSSVPVINGLTDKTHPCQLMADVMTYEEHMGSIEGGVVAWCGDGNNMAASWIHAAVRFGFELRLACPDRLRPPGDMLAWAEKQQGEVYVTSDVQAAVTGADCVVTDTWVSMGDDVGESIMRQNVLKDYQVNAEIMALAKPNAIFQHCLPAHRGQEVTDEVMDGPRSVVWDEAENRLHVQKGIMLWCMGGFS